ncbi:alpha/beta fold hydrolase [Streptomyces sp. NPDC060205]|uniref:alpha/beta fold hydrolase n=1 Tax=Streptomyces sp. NPDC060205 TaxID=3347072 RepID=UPI0036521E07
MRIHHVSGGEGEPVVIVHGGWDSSWAWRHVAPALAESNRIILPSIRGLANSSKPEGGYDARTLGADLYRMLRELGISRCAAVIGHDWGALAAYSLAAQHPEMVDRLAIFEMAMPGTGVMERAMTPQPHGDFLWHMGFNSVPDMPELLIRPHLREYMHWFFTHFAHVPDAVDREALDHYVDLYQQVGALRAILAIYQNFWVHAEQVTQMSATPLEMPVLAYGGDTCFGPLTREAMSQLARNVHGGVIPDCGHWVAEENAPFVVDALRYFLLHDMANPDLGKGGQDSVIAAARL